MGVYTVVTIPGDGIGQEIVSVAQQVVDVALVGTGHTIQWQHALAGGASIDVHGVPLTEETIEQCKAADAVLLGAVGGPQWDDVAPELRPERAILGLRKALGLYCNIRPIKVMPPLAHRSPLRADIGSHIDFIIVRELTGGIYFGERCESDGEQAWDKETYHTHEVERIMDIAITMAKGRKNHIVSVDKANVLASSRLWRQVTTEKGKAAGVAVDHLYVDNAAMQIVLNPSQFDVMVTTNLFGDILSDEGAAVTGSIGLLPSASMGDGTSLYEPIHGSAPDIAGQGIANPIGTILSAAMMCRYSLGLPDVANRIEQAVERTLADGVRTGDIREDGLPVVGTKAMGDAVIARL